MLCQGHRERWHQCCLAPGDGPVSVDSRRNEGGTSPAGPMLNPARGTTGAWLTYTVKAAGPPQVGLLLLLLLPQGVVQLLEAFPPRREGARLWPP